MGERTVLPCGCVITGKGTRFCPAHAIAEDKRVAAHRSPFWRRLDYSLSGLAILFVLIWFGGAVIVAIVDFIFRFWRTLSFGSFQHALYALVLWAGAAAVAFVLFVFIDRLIRYARR